MNNLDHWQTLAWLHCVAQEKAEGPLSPLSLGRKGDEAPLQTQGRKQRDFVSRQARAPHQPAPLVVMIVTYTLSRNLEWLKLFFAYGLRRPAPGPARVRDIIASSTSLQ